jgi:hypothetical protein
MMFLALPDAPPALVENATTAPKPAVVGTPTYGVCAFASNAAGLGDELSPSRFLLDLLPGDFTDRLKANDLTQQEWDWLGNWDKQISITVLSGPQHGRLDHTSSLTYYAEQGFKGKDRIEVMVSSKDIAGHAISMKLIYFINVVSTADFHNVANNYSRSLSQYCHVQSESWRLAPIEKVSGTI